MVSDSNPPMEPLRSRINTISVKLFFMILTRYLSAVSGLFSASAVSIGLFGYDMVASQATSLLAQGWLFVLEQRKIDREIIVYAVFNKILNDEIKDTARRKCISGASEKVFCLVKFQFQCKS